MVDCLGVEINIIILFSCDSDLYQILKIYFSFELYLIDQSFELVTFLLFSRKYEMVDMEQSFLFGNILVTSPVYFF